MSSSSCVSYLTASSGYKWMFCGKNGKDFIFIYYWYIWVIELNWTERIYLEKEMATHSSILAWKIPWRAAVHRVSKSQPWLSSWAHYWCIVDFQCCVNFCCTAKWLSYTRVYILFNIPLHYGLSQGIGWNPLCSAVGPCCVSILYNSLRLLTPNS